MPETIPALDLLQQLDKRVLAAYLDGRLSYLRHKPPNFRIARALLWASRVLQGKVLSVLNPIRRHRVEMYLQSYTSGGNLELAVACWTDNFIVPILTRRKQAILAELKTKILMFTELCIGLRKGETPLITEHRMSSYLPEEPDPL